MKRSKDDIFFLFASSKSCIEIERSHHYFLHTTIKKKREKLARKGNCNDLNFVVVIIMNRTLNGGQNMAATFLAKVVH
jgi:hypothetical protein